MSQIKLKVTSKFDLTSRLNVLLWKNKLLLKYLEIYGYFEIIFQTFLFFNASNTDFFYLELVLTLNLFSKIISKIIQIYYYKFILDRNITESKRLKYTNIGNNINTVFVIYMLISVIYYYFKIPNLSNNYYLILYYEFWKIIIFILSALFFGYLFLKHEDNYYVSSVAKKILPIENELLIIHSSTKKKINDTCPICLEKNNLDFVLNCGHCYHKNCISKWVIDNEKCPYCNQSVLNLNE